MKEIKQFKCPILGKKMSEAEYILFMQDMNKQFQRLKEAPIEEYLSRILNISKQLGEINIK